MVKPNTKREKKATPKPEKVERPEDVLEIEAEKEQEAAKALLVKTDLNPIPMKGTKNKKLRKKLKVKNATLLKIQIEKETSKQEDEMELNKKKRNKLLPNKPTMAERVQLRKLKKHDPGKAPAYEQYLADKYSVKKDKMNI